MSSFAADELIARDKVNLYVPDCARRDLRTLDLDNLPAREINASEIVGT